MDLITEIFKYSFVSIVWGVLIAVASFVLFVLLIKGWYRNATFSPVSWIVAVLLFLALSIQCSALVGSLMLLQTINVFEEYSRDVIDSYLAPHEEPTSEEFNKIFDSILEEYPLIKYYVDSAEFHGYTASELPKAMAEELHSFLSWYIVRRLLWCLGFVVVAAIVVIRFMNPRTTQLLRYEVGNIESDDVF